MSNKIIIDEMLFATINEIQNIVNSLDLSESLEYLQMVDYHLGLSDNKTFSRNKGKMIRPLILLLCSNHPNSGRSWKNAIPAAAAVELLHNFSLIHDDIQDNSPLRRNRETIWKIWGIPQAINTGDGLFAMANISSENLEEFYPPDIVIKVMRIFNKTCLDLTIGQHMDISFEDNDSVTLDQYWKMIEYKTARLISTSALIGGILAGFETKELSEFISFGKFLGLAFQIEDDILGIWGKEGLTGKSNTKDLEEAKKTLPVLYGLHHSQNFAERWKKGNISTEESIRLADQLKIDGVMDFAQDQAASMTNKALKSLRKLPIRDPYKKELINLTANLLKRET